MRRRSGWLTLGLLIVAAGWAIHALDIEARDLAAALHNLLLFAHDVFPPNWEVWRVGWPALVQTLQIAYLGTLIGIVFSLPLAVLAARNLAPAWISVPVRWVLAAVRVLPALLWAVLFVIIVGLGPFAGVLAIGLYSIGYLGKLQYETIEGLPAITLETADTMGLKGWQKVRHVVLPESANSLLSQALFMFEYNVRATAIVGFVGAGGIGQLIMTYLQFNLFANVFTLLIMIFLAVLVIDWVSLKVRTRFLEHQGPQHQARWRDLMPWTRRTPKV